MNLEAFADAPTYQEQVRLEEQLAELNAEYAAFAEDLRLFEYRYLRAVGALLLERDQLSSALAALLAARAPHDQEQQQAASAAEEQHQHTRATVGEIQEIPPLPPVSAELKALFRAAAKRLHPDKGHSEEDRARRTGFMARVNAAYACRDAEAIQQALHDFGQSEKVGASDTGLKIAETLEQLHARIDQRRRELQNLQVSALGQLFAQAQAAAGGEDAFFRRRSQHISLQVQELQERLQHLMEAAHA